ncbi:MAG: hypothetical protein WCK31_05135, partial [bacterium]
MNIIVITGAYPDIGKGIFTSSLAYLLQDLGIKVSPLKFDGYYNFSSGTMNPYHGDTSSKYSKEEVFVLADGYEGDADSGYYERFLHNQFKKESNITNGQLFSLLTNSEGYSSKRPGQVLNHRFLRNILIERIAAEAKKVDTLFIEIGGTVGDKENEIIFEALRLIKDQKNAKIFTILMSPYFSK